MLCIWNIYKKLCNSNSMCFFYSSQHIPYSINVSKLKMGGGSFLSDPSSLIALPCESVKQSLSVRAIVEFSLNGICCMLQDWYTGFCKLLHGFVWNMYLSKFLHGLVKVVFMFFLPFAKQTKLKFDQDFKACWSFCFELKVLIESKYSSLGSLVQCLERCFFASLRCTKSCGQISVAGAGTGVIKSRQAGLSGAGLYNADVQCFNCSLWPCAGLRTRQLIDWPESRRLELQLQVVLVAQSQPEPRSTFPCSPFLVTTNQPLTKSLFYLVTTTQPLTKSLC